MTLFHPFGRCCPLLHNLLRFTLTGLFLLLATRPGIAQTAANRAAPRFFAADAAAARAAAAAPQAQGLRAYRAHTLYLTSLRQSLATAPVDGPATDPFSNPNDNNAIENQATLPRADCVC